MKVDYNKMQECYNNINKISQDLIENMENIKKTINSLGNNELWNGNGYNAYNSKVNTISSNFASSCNELKKLSTVILTSIEKYKLVDTKVRQSLEGINT